MQTVTRTLKEELMWDRSRVTSVDWVTYPILTFPEIPEVEVELIDRPKEGGVATAVRFPCSLVPVEDAGSAGLVKPRGASRVPTGDPD